MTTDPRAGVEIPGENIKFRFTFAALVEIEENTGRPLPDVAQGWADGKRPMMKDLQAVVAAGLRHAKPDVTADEVSDMIERVRIVPMCEVVGTALNAAYGMEEAGGNGKRAKS